MYELCIVELEALYEQFFLYRFCSVVHRDHHHRHHHCPVVFALLNEDFRCDRLLSSHIHVYPIDDDDHPNAKGRHFLLFFKRNLLYLQHPVRTWSVDEMSSPKQVNMSDAFLLDKKYSSIKNEKFHQNLELSKKKRFFLDIIRLERHLSEFVQHLQSSVINSIPAIEYHERNWMFLDRSSFYLLIDQLNKATSTFPSFEWWIIHGLLNDKKK